MVVDFFAPVSIEEYHCPGCQRSHIFGIDPEFKDHFSLQVAGKIVNRPATLGEKFALYMERTEPKPVR